MKKLFHILAILLFVTVSHAADVGYTYVQGTPWSNYNTTGFNNFEINSTTDAIEYIFQCQAACSITDLGYRYGVRSGTPCAQKFHLQGVNTSGRADGSDKTGATVSFTPPASTADDDLLKYRTLGTPYSCTGGEFLAAVLDDVSDGCTPTTVTAASSYSYNNNNWPDSAFPMVWTVDSGSGTARSGPVPFAYKCGSTVYGNPVQTLSAFNFGSDSTPDERGAYFKLPATSCSTAKLAGIRWNGYFSSAASSGVVAVYSGLTSTSAVSGATVTLDTDAWAGLGSSRHNVAYFGTPATITCGSDYVVAIAPTHTGGAEAALAYTQGSVAGDLSALALGTSMYYANRTDAASNWTTDTTIRPHIDLILTDITAPSSGGIKNQNQTSGGAQ